MSDILDDRIDAATEILRRENAALRRQNDAYLKALTERAMLEPPAPIIFHSPARADDLDRLASIAEYLDTPEVAATDDSWYLNDLRARLAATLPTALTPQSAVPSPEP